MYPIQGGARFMRPPRRRSLKAIAAAAAAAGLLGLSVAVVVPPAAVAAAGSCSAAYSVSSDWGSGFTAAITVTDTGTTAITGWTLTYAYTGNQTLQSGWSGNWSQSGQTVTVTNASWNGSLAAGASTSIGANFGYSGTNTAPASVTCTPAGGTSPPPPGAITASTSSLAVTQGSTGTFTLALSTAPAADVTVSVAASGNTGLTASPASLTFTPSDYATAQTETVTANSSGTGTTTFTASASGYTSVTITATETASTGGGGSCGSGITLQANPSSFSVPQGGTEVFGVSLSASPSAAISVTVAQTSGNTGLSVSSGSSITLSSSNWNLPQPVYVAANSSGTGAATFTVSASGCASVTVQGTEAAAGSGTAGSHVTNPFTGAGWYVNPDYTAEVATSAAAASGTLAAQMTAVGKEPTFIWLDHIGAIYGGSDNMSGSGNTARLSLEAQLQNAASSASGPTIFPIVIYDLPDRDCAALASNGELSISNNGLSYYEHSYIDPIAQILSNYQNTNLRIVAVIEPDSLPNLVTNESVSNCSQANSSGVYVDGIEYALNKLHAIPNVYNYMDIAHSAWLGWPSNMTPAVSLYKQVASATTAGVASVDGFISDTANTIPVHEPYLTATETVDGSAVDTVQYYSYDPYIDEFTYDEAMYSNLVSAGFSPNVGMLIDTSRDGWGDPSLRPTSACPNNIASSCSTTVAFVNASKIDERPFRGDWCNPENAGIGALPQANPDSTFTHLYAYVWVKPPGESDGTYPAFSGTGDPHCDPNGTQTDGSGNTYPTDAIPDSPPAGHWFPVEFSQLVQDAYPAIP
jgi:cellulose 1,4-beta-cellobiosidase